MRDSDRQCAFRAPDSPSHRRRGSKHSSLQANWWARACAALMFCLVAAVVSAGQTLTTLYSFCSETLCTDGDDPYAGLTQGTDGSFYGTTYYGGADVYGTIFKITRSGMLTTVRSFCLQPGCTDGATPYAAVVQATNGAFFGMTAYGGTNGYGTVYKLGADGVIATIHNFCSRPLCGDGSAPLGELIQATDGSFYGTAWEGGAHGNGTVFKITPVGALTVLYSFCSQSPCLDGQLPTAGLIQGTDDNFYGTTSEGGASGFGAVFKIAPNGILTTLHSFASTDGAYPQAALVQGQDGSFYGTTNQGGTNGYGTIFRITATGILTTLHSFDLTDGSEPFSGLVQATDGYFYGTTSAGGTNLNGTIFRISPSGAFTTLYSFCAQTNCPDGADPWAALLQGTDGNFYGTTLSGGVNRRGSVFRLSVGLGPFVKPQPTSGASERQVKILGNNLSGATSVTFNGTPATFTVVSPSLITTTVPAGATTGTVQVVTPGGTLSSNVPFRVVQ